MTDIIPIPDDMAEVKKRVSEMDPSEVDEILLQERQGCRDRIKELFDNLATNEKIDSPNIAFSAISGMLVGKVNAGEISPMQVIELFAEACLVIQDMQENLSSYQMGQPRRHE